MTLIHFHVPSVNFAHWWPNIWPKMGFRNIRQNYWLNSFDTWYIYPYEASLLAPIHFRVPGVNFGSSGGQIFGQKWDFQNF